MPWRYRLRHGIERHTYPVALAWGESNGSVMAAVVGEVEKAVADAGGAPVGRDVGKPDRDDSDRLVDGELEVGHRGAENLHSFGDVVAVEDQGAPGFLALDVG